MRRRLELRRIDAREHGDAVFEPLFWLDQRVVRVDDAVRVSREPADGVEAAVRRVGHVRAARERGGSLRRDRVGQQHAILSGQSDQFSS